MNSFLKGIGRALIPGLIAGCLTVLTLAVIPRSTHFNSVPFILVLNGILLLLMFKISATSIHINNLLYQTASYLSACASHKTGASKQAARSLVVLILKKVPLTVITYISLIVLMFCLANNNGTVPDNAILQSLSVFNYFFVDALLSSLGAPALNFPANKIEVLWHTIASVAKKHPDKLEGLILILTTKDAEHLIDSIEISKHTAEVNIKIEYNVKHLLNHGHELIEITFFNEKI